MAPSSKPGPAASGTQPVVAGIAARMPQSGSTAEFWKNLVDGKNMITKDDTHWESGFHGQLPLGKGSLTQQEHFDNFFFNMSGAQAEKTDPQLRFLLELSYEALVDSNLDIQKLKGSNCGVFVGSCFSDCHKAWLNDVPAIVGYENTGCAQSMYANRLSFFYDFHGPSFNVDTACSSSLVAFSQACRALESGECDVCLVGGSSITLHAGVSVAFNKLSMLSKDSACMSFSKNGNGYARSEGVAIMVLYREDKVGKYMRDEEDKIASAASDSQAAMKRVTRPNSYFKVLGFGINSDGFTKKGITFPNGEAQLSLYKEVCDRAMVDPADIFYIEAHGTGTAAGDGQELEALRRAYLEPRNAKTRKASSAGAGGNNFDLPLLLGSVKSNMGHAEGASAMAGLMKLCLSAAHGLIPANLHYTYEERNTGCEGILGDKKKCMVVEEHFPIAGGASGKNVAISSFGFGGTNAHAVMCGQVAEPLVLNKGANYKGSDVLEEAADKKLAEFMSAAETSEEQWKYITPVFGRTADGVQACLETLGEKGVSFSELVGNPCVHDHQKEFPALGYRTSAGDVITTDEAQRYVTPAPGADESDETKPRPLYLLFSGNGGMWPMMGKELHQSSKVYRETFDRCCDHLEKAHGYTGARQFLTEPDITKYTAVEGVCGLAAVQISLVAMLKEAGLEWEGMFGHSAGETAMGYADGCLTLEETMSVAYFRSLCGADSVDKENPGGMYACGVSREKMEELLKRYNCSELTQVGCDNDPGMVTLSGCEKEMKPICVELTSKKILCRKVPTFGVAFHSAMLEKGLAKLSAQLEEVIDNAPNRTKESRRRSEKWISTCYDDEEIRKDPNHPGNFISAEYHYYNFRNTVEFYRAVKARVPANAVVVEVGPSGLFRSSIKKIAAAEKRPMHYFSLMSREKNCLHTFQNAFGQLFFQGLVPNLKVRTRAQPNALGQLSHIHLTPKDVPAIARDIELKQAFVMWDHGSVYPIPTTADMLQKTGAEGEELRTGMSADDWKNMHAVDFDFTSERDKFIVDHVIDKTVLMPACGYIYCAWEAFAHVLKKRESIAELSEARDVALVDFKIQQGIRLDDSNLQMRLMVKFEQQNPANGENEFKILNGEEKIVTGKIKLVKGTAESMNSMSANLPDTETFGHALGSVNSMEFYNRIARNGYNYETAFQLVENVGIDDSWAWVRFDKAADIVAEKEAKAKAKAAAEAASAEAGNNKGASSPAVEGVSGGKTVVPLGGAPDANVAETGQLGGAGEKEKGSIYSSEEVVFNRYWISYLDNLLQVSLLKNLNDSETLRVPTVIREVTIRGSAFGSFLKKMREGNMGSMRHIASNDSVVSRVSSVEVEKEVQEEERKSYIVEAQVQSGTQLVKILPYMNQVSSDIADVVGLQTSIMARSTKAKERRVLHVARKKVQDLASTIQVAKPKTAHALLVSYLKEQFVSGNFSVLDFCPQLVDELTQSFVETNNVEKFAVKFLPQAGVDGEKNPGRMEFAISEEKVGEYNAKLDGICEEMKDGDKFDVVLVHSGEVLKSKEDVELLVKTLAEESKKTEEFQPSFIVVATDLRTKKGSDSAAALAATGVVNDSALLRIVASNAGAGIEFALYKTVSGDADLPSAAVQEFSGADGLMSGAGQQAAPAKEGQEEAAAAKKATAPVQFIRLSDDCFCREHISKLSAFIGELTADESLKKLYLLSSSAGFPGFLKCLQREPGAYAKIRGVHLVASNNASIGYSSNVTEALAAALQPVASTDARLVRLDVKTGRLSVELSSYDESEKKFPAPFGRFLTFPQPGNLEAFKWKAHPHFSVLSLGDDDAVKNSLEGRILLPAVTSVQRSYSKSGTDSGLRGSSIEELAEEAKKCTPPLGDTCASVRTEMQTDKYELSLPLGLTRGSENMKRTGSSGSLLGSLFGAAGVSTDTKNDEKAKKEKSPENTTTAKRDISPKTALSKGAMKAAQLSEEELLAESLQQQYLATLTASTLKDLTLYNNAQKQNPLRYVDVSFAALNFRDVMLAYNKIDKDALVGHSKVGDGFGLEFAGFYRKSDLEAQCLQQGDLFSAHHGTDNDNDQLRVKVVGLTYNSLASKVTVPSNLVWELKPTQSLREFATVPCVYATCYYSLLVRGQFSPTTSVLIHAGAGGVGQAALYICLKRTSNPNLIFTTCSSKKRAYLMEKFGHLGLVEKNIGNTRDCSFENLVMQRTGGRGVDICVNSLSDDKLMASVRCVAPFGRFCEIGKYDLMQNTGLGMHCLLKNVSIMGIDLDQILNQPAEWAIVHRLVQEGLNSGEVEPLDVGGCFPTTQITEAFRFMGAGTHVGKVLLSFENQGSSTTSSAQSDSSDPTPDNASSTTAGVTSRTVSEQGSVANAFHPPARAAEDARQLSGESNSSARIGSSSSADKVADTPNFTPKDPANDVYVIIGGLGGFGLELTQFLASKGVKNLILSSRGRLRNGLQAKYLTEVAEKYRCNISITNLDFSDRSVTEKFLSANRNVCGFFNLGMVLADGLFKTMQGSQWATPILAKGVITENFDQAAAKLNLHFDHFVLFSSVSAGLGNAGQTNYGFANSELDQIVRLRNAAGKAALSVQWGAIGDVGVLSRASKKTGLVDAILPQEILSCLAELEKLLAANETGVHTVYLTPKRMKEEGGSVDNSVPLVDKVIEIVGAKNPKDSATLEMLGADSLQSMEIQSLIKMRTGEKIPMDKLSKMTVKMLREIEA
mmetsp:Transcript_18751/g.46867  ORF Transcript_18751/g.46867 Transcript_18751/m.46867 type:complete len:2716 (+) Transcript_18751:643-8790(+)|eukprot:CAMPEP_0178987814 /NCGR_PEP_ID=MMETSP0795-20121207/3476_1 /TAXON_ID=88552 /ORGANISM="Amoebophrya sp., Strain Ameob2" /LENGTH=2715 /DNA_ID=CAMNT_0020679043 /DNA_START=626 /DNA_END=8773 /DNA_ORIENTATION=-